MDIIKQKEIEIARENIEDSVASGNMYPNTGRLLNKLLDEALNMRKVGVTFKDKETPEIDSFIIMRAKEEKDDFIIFKGKKYTLEEFTNYRK